MVKKIYIVSLIIIFLFVSWFLISVPKENKNQISVEAENSIATTEEEKTDNVLKENDSWTQLKMVLRKEDIYSEGQMFQQDNWKYCIDAVSVTKIQGDWKNPDYMDYYNVDKDGNLQNDYSYLCVDITIECIEDETELEFWLNNITYLILDQNSDDVGGGELAACSSIDSEEKDCFRYLLRENEKIETRLIFIVEDTWISNNNYILLQVNNHGMNYGVLDSNEYTFVLLESIGKGREEVSA